jgi:hypothetical protein
MEKSNGDAALLPQRFNDDASITAARDNVGAGVAYPQIFNHNLI